MIIYKDHNGTTTFNESVKRMSFSELKKVFGDTHDVLKLAKLFGVRVEDKVSIPQVEVEKPKKKKED